MTQFLLSYWLKLRGMVSEKAGHLVLASWCPNCNIPVLNGGPCGSCSSETKKIPANTLRIKPVFPEEKKFYNQVIDRSLNIADDLLPLDECFISCGSIVVDGKKTFHISFGEGEWKAKGYEKFIAGDLIGSRIEKILQANDQLLKEKEREAVDFLKDTLGQYDLPAIVSMSGGKDSLVALDLALQVDKQIPVIYMNTTLDFPETVDYIHDITRKLRLNLVETLPERTFLDLSKELGPPSSMMPWCCQTQKFAPFSKYLNKNFPEGVLSIEGLRKFESGKRMGYSRVSQNPAIPKKKTVCPILNWTSLDVWLYILWKKLPFNPVYRLGYERIGCWVCPHKGLSSFRMMEKTHPDLLNGWKEFLLSYASCNGKDTEWVSEGKWRLRHESYEKIPLHAKKLCGNDNSLLYEIKGDNNLKQIKEFMKIFGESKGNQNISIIRGQDIQISVIGSNLRVTYSNKLIARLFEKQLMKAMNCVGCGACVGACKALKIRERKLTVDEKECNHCLRCTSSKHLRMGCIALNYGKRRFVWQDEPLLPTNN